MDDVENAIEEFRREDTAKIVPVDHSRKPDLIAALENHLEDPRVMAFMLTVIVDENEFDLARVEALKVLEIAPKPAVKMAQEIASGLRAVLVKCRDLLVRQYASLATWQYLSDKNLFDTVVAIVRNQSEDVDVRYNCFGALERMADRSRAQSVMQSLERDPTLGASAHRVLQEWRTLSE